jgi:hypothetical protein
MGGKGLEHPADPPRKTPIPQGGGAESGARGAPEAVAGGGAADDPDLRRVVEAWPALPPAVRAGVVAMVRASAGASTANGLAP